MSNRKKKTERDEVEELLRATEDDILLKLSVNSHMSRGSSSSIIDPDLDRRFQALRKPTKKPSNPNPNPPPPPSSSPPNPETHEDVFARFAALKGSKSDNSNPPPPPPPSSSFSFYKDDDEDEVEKLIRWAVDAARLDPSPPSDEDDDSNDDDDDEVEDKKKGKRR